MKTKMNRNRIENLMTLMQAIRKVEYSPKHYKSSDSRHEEVYVYWIDGMYPGLLIETSTGHHIFVRREMTGMSYSDQFSIEDWTGSDWVKYAFDPSDGIYGLTRNCQDMFAGGFMDACGYILDFWMSRG